MFKIGDFSKLSRVSVNTLRYYDQLGLLKPAWVDRFTDYRYYSADQLPRLHRILALKDLGFTLEEIARFLETAPAVEELRGLLQLKRAEVERQAQAELARLARVEARLQYLEQEGKMPQYEVVLKTIEPQWVATARAVVPTVAEMPERCGAMFYAVYTWMLAHGIRPSDVCLSIYYNPEYTEHDIDVETAALVVALPAEPVVAAPGDTVVLRQLEAVSQMACTVHHGSLDYLLQAYAAIGQWIQANGYHIVGPCREIYLQDPHGDSPVTEIQYPVEKG